MEVESFSRVFDNLGIGFNPVGLEVLFEFILLLILLLCSALVSGSETAFFSLSPVERNKLIGKKSKKHLAAKSLLELPEKMLATVLILNNFVNVGIVILSTYITQSIFDFSQAPIIGYLFNVVAITFTILLFGEILPKIYAHKNATRMVLFVAPGLYAFLRILSPISNLLISSTVFIKRRLARYRKNISVSDLSQALDLTSGTLTDEKKILKGIVTFGNTSVSEIMRPRVDVISVSTDASLSKLIGLVVESGYSRIPVYEETFDNVKGILYIKDLLPHLDKHNNFNWLNLIRPAFFVPESRKIDDLLRDFQNNKIHMGIVIDEYGGTRGIITLEDVLEEIVGEISDESDREEMIYSKINDNTYIFEGKILINDFHKITQTDDSAFDEIRGDAETLAGLILELKGEIPQKNEKFLAGSYTFIVESVDARRIKQIKVIIDKKEKNTITR